MAKRVMAEKLKNWKIGCCDYGVADCGCNIYGASSGVAAGISDVCRVIVILVMVEIKMKLTVLIMALMVKMMHDFLF